MKTTRALAIVFILIPTIAFAWTGKVVNVSDGDTITVMHDGTQTKVRLYGIDSPEKAQPFGQKARDLAASMVAGKTVEVKEMDTDRYGRTVGMVTVEGRGLNEAMVQNGYAWVYRQYCKERFCADWSGLEGSARQQGKGMWADPHIVPPWEWRHGGKQVAVANPTASDDEGQAVKQDSSGGEFRGNVNSHKFHRPGCQHYNCKNCTATFGSRDKAVAAGYSPCGICRP